MFDLNLAGFLFVLACGLLGYLIGYERGWAARLVDAVEKGGRVVQGEEDGP